jgi:hypothetical protein
VRAANMKNKSIVLYQLVVISYSYVHNCKTGRSLRGQLNPIPFLYLEKSSSSVLHICWWVS